MIWGKVISFTERGAEIGRRIKALMPEDRIELYARGEDASLKETSLTRMVQQAMVDCRLIVFVGTADAAAQAIAPYVQGNTYDPVVLAVDEKKESLISLLAEHFDGSDALVRRLSDGLGIPAVSSDCCEISEKE